MNGVLVRAVVALLSLAAIAAPAAARACSCLPASIQRRVIPRDGTTDLPLDTRVRVLVTGGLPRLARDGLVREYRLRDDSGALVPLVASADDTLLTLVPAKPLAPRTRYTLERAYVFDAGGARVSDDRRMQASWGVNADPPRPPPALQRRWFPESGFTTGDGTEPAPPAAPISSGARLDVGYGTSCGAGAALSVSYLTGPRPTDLLGLEIEGLGIVRTFAHDFGARAASGHFVVSISDMSCTPDPLHLVIGETLAVRLVTISARGEIARPAAFTRVTLPQRVELERAGATQPPPARDDQPYVDAAARAFLGAAAPIREPPALRATTRGPPSCPHGLVSVGEIAMPAGTLPWMAGSRPSLSGSGQLHTVYVDGDEHAELISFNPTYDRVKLTPIAGPGSELTAAFGHQRFVTAATVFGPRDGNAPASAITVAQHDYAKSTRWRTPLDGPGLDWHPQVVWTNQHVLAAWHTDQRRAGYAVLEAERGTIVRRGDLPLPRRDGAIAISTTAGADPPFAMAWTPPDDGDVVSWAPIDARGHLAEAESVAADGHPRDLALAPFAHGRMALAIAGDTLTMQTVGDARRPPTRIDAGVDGQPATPQLTSAYDGTTGYVTWSAGDRGYVTVFDLDGRAAPAIPLNDGAAITVPRVRAERDGTVLVQYGAGSVNRGAVPRLERFACARAPRLSAPERIE